MLSVWRVVFIPTLTSRASSCLIPETAFVRSHPALITILLLEKEKNISQSRTIYCCSREDMTALDS